MYISIEKIVHNGMIIIERPNGVGFDRFVGYSMRDAISRWRYQHGLKGKHIVFVKTERW